MYDETHFTAPARHRYAGLGLIRSGRGRVLLVERAYGTGRERFGLVGGSALPGEPGSVACQRGVREETGLRLVPGAVLVVHFVPGGEDVAERTDTVFDCGVVPEETALVLPRQVLAGYRWVHPEDLRGLVMPFLRWRIELAMQTLHGGTARYLVGHPDFIGSLVV